MLQKLPITSLLVCALLASDVVAEELFYRIEPHGERTLVEFTSRARIETFSGTSAALSGWFALDPDSLASLRGELTLDLTDLDTGIGLRNRHMHETVLHSDRHPTATLIPTGREGGPLGSDPSGFRVLAQLSLHGETRPIEVDVEARREGDGIVLAASFEVVLEDFGIRRPRMLILKVAEKVQIKVDAFARPTDPPKPEP